MGNREWNKQAIVFLVYKYQNSLSAFIEHNRTFKTRTNCWLYAFMYIQNSHHFLPLKKLPFITKIRNESKKTHLYFPLLYFTFSNFSFIQCCIVFKFFPLINQHLLRRRINIRSLYNCDMIYCDCQQLDASWAQRKFSLSNCFFNRRGQQLEPSFR